MVTNRLYIIQTEKNEYEMRGYISIFSLATTTMISLLECMNVSTLNNKTRYQLIARMENRRAENSIWPLWHLHVNL